MAIVETKITVRPNTSVSFFNLSNNPVLIAVRALFDASSLTVLENQEKYYKCTNASGSYTAERIYSDDMLTQTERATYDNLTTWGDMDSLMSIELDNEFIKYTTENGFVPPGGSQYTLAGINAPFTCTTTYTYNPATVTTNYPQFDDFAILMETHDKLTGFTNTGTQLIAVHTYDNADDFTINHWRDYNFITGLHAGGVTRSISYAML